jgi:hypothetical protein
VANSLDDTRDATKFSWLDGSDTAFAELADPRQNAYGLCVYDMSGATPTLLFGQTRQDGSWKEVGKPLAPTGYQTLTTLPKFVLHAGTSGKAKVKFSGKGFQLGLPRRGSRRT